MWLYGAMARVFPSSFVAKVFFVAFVGTHVPLLAILVWAIWTDGGWLSQWQVLMVALLATLAGTAVTLAALHQILKPIYRAEAAIRAFESNGEVRPLPFGFGDQAGRLMDATNRLILSVEDRLAASRRVAETDPLTGLLNRRGFDRRVGPGAVGAILLLDIDGFKSVNDRFGHAEGDRVLRDLAALLTHSVRRSDVVARFGGEEFMIFLPGAPADFASDTAQRLCRTVADQLRAGGDAVTVSIGFALSVQGQDRDGLIARADRQLYEAKKSGRNRACFDGRLAGMA